MKSLALVLLAACTQHPAVAVAPVTAGISIALYQGYGVVDDRRWIELADHELALDHIDPGASLASLVIEPLGGAPFAIERCSREGTPAPPPAPVEVARTREQVELERLAYWRRQRALRDPRVGAQAAVTPPMVAATAPIVRCTIEGAPGKRLVRILYVSRSLAYTAQHDLAMTEADRAELASRFTFVTPNWRDRAEVTVFDGSPGGEHPVTELAHGAVALDGSTAILAPKPRTVAARLLRIYDGAIATPEADIADASWNAQSVHLVWVWVELANTALSPGPVHARIEVPGEPLRELDLPASLRAPLAADLRLPLWPDEQLSGSRTRISDVGAENELADRVMLSISNLGDVPREVWVEEYTRRARSRRIEHGWPSRPQIAGDLVRAKVEVKPHAVERAGFTLRYAF